MSSNEIFEINRAIGRKGYILNVLLLVICAIITNCTFTNYFLVHAKTDTAIQILNMVKYFLYFVYLMLFFSLINRRLSDITGDTDNKQYKRFTSFFGFVISFQIICIILKTFSLPFLIDIDNMQQFAYCLDCAYLLAAFLLIFPKSKQDKASTPPLSIRNKQIKKKKAWY